MRLADDAAGTAPRQASMATSNRQIWKTYAKKLPRRSHLSFFDKPLLWLPPEVQEVFDAFGV
ncbi:MAG: hypothetical protein RQ750_17745 [Roseovarius sp.]|nr:hypothetical protein [Roseovarius sp.]